MLDMCLSGQVVKLEATQAPLRLDQSPFTQNWYPGGQIDAFENRLARGAKGLVARGVSIQPILL